MVVGAVREQRSGLRFTQVRAALLFCHGIAQHDRRVVGHFAPAEFVLGAAHLVGPDLEAGLGLKTNERSVGHAGRTSRAMLDLVPEIGQRGPGKVRLGLAGRPGQGVHLMFPGQGHQLVPARMKFDPVHAVAIAVMRLEFGQMTVGKAGQFLHRFVAYQLAQRLATPGRPRRFALHGGTKHRVMFKGVEAGQGQRLILDDVGATMADAKFCAGKRFTALTGAFMGVSGVCRLNKQCEGCAVQRGHAAVEAGTVDFIGQLVLIARTLPKRFTKPIK